MHLKDIKLTLSLGLGLLSLVACQGKTSATPSLMPEVQIQTALPTGTAQPGVLLVSQDELKGAVVTVWSPWLDERGDQLGYLIDDFNQNNSYGIRVNLTTWGGETALTDALTAGTDLPDVFISSPEEAFRLKEAGLLLLALDGYQASPTWGLTGEELEDRIEAAWQLGQSDSSQYGIPAAMDAQFLFYNLTWGLELGFNAPPQTRADFLLQSCKANKANNEDGLRENNGTGGWLIPPGSNGLLAWLVAAGYPLPAGGPYTFDTPEARSVLDYLKNLEVKGCAWLGKADTPYEYFSKRYALMVSGSLSEVAAQRAALSQAGLADQWVLIPYPDQSGDKPTLVTGSSYFVIPSDASHQMAAWIFLHWMDEPTQQLRLLQVSGGWPTYSSAAEAYAAEFESDLAYSYVLNAMMTIRPVPHTADWSIARRLFEDAAWQLFQPETRSDQIPTLLAELDETIREILSIEGK